MFGKAYRRVFRFLGAILEGNHDRGTVFFLDKAARAGDPWSQNNLAACYQTGRGVSVDIQKAIDLYREAANGSQIEACLNLGQIYYEGKSVPRDDSESSRWFAKAAELGDARGEYRLGLMYYDGVGVERDYQKAFVLLSSARRKGIVIDDAIFSEISGG